MWNSSILRVFSTSFSGRRGLPSRRGGTFNCTFLWARMSCTSKPQSALTLSPSSSILSSFSNFDCAVISRSDTRPPQSGDRNVTSPHGDIPTSALNVLRLLYCEYITDCCKRLVGRCTYISMQSMITRVDGYFAKHGGMVTSMTFLLGIGNKRGSSNAKKEKNHPGSKRPWERRRCKSCAIVHLFCLQAQVQPGKNSKELFFHWKCLPRLLATRWILLSGFRLTPPLAKSNCLFLEVLGESQENTNSRQTGVKPCFFFIVSFNEVYTKISGGFQSRWLKSAIRSDKAWDLFSSSISFNFPSRCAKRSSTVSFMSELNDNSVPTSTSADMASS